MKTEEFFKDAKIENSVEALSESEIDKIYDQVDSLMRENDVDGLDAMILALPSEIDLQIAFLSASIPFRGELTKRDGLLAAAREKITSLGENPEEVLLGL